MGKRKCVCKQENARWTIFSSDGEIYRVGSFCFELLSGVPAKDVFEGKLDRWPY